MENIFACTEVMDLTEEAAERCSNVKNTYLKHRQSKSKPVREGCGTHLENDQEKRSVVDAAFGKAVVPRACGGYRVVQHRPGGNAAHD